MKHVPILILPLGLLFFLGVMWLASQTDERPKQDPQPDFSTINDVKIKKKTFFDYLLPKVRRANDQILAQRKQLLMLVSELDQDRTPSQTDAEWLQELALTYRVKGDPIMNENVRRELVTRVDAIPASLVLAQAANESAWGTARFAREGNNFFGLWCWARNCGMVPNDREPERKHEVASFKTVDAGIRYYLLTLNSHPAYHKLRIIRQKARANDETATGLDLAAGLEKYSERGADYIREIRSMIRVNHLTRLNRDFESL